MTSTIPFNVRRARPALVLAALAVAVSGALVAPGARASGFQLKENSAKALGRAFAGFTTAGGDASVVANNPAAMSELGDRSVFQADVTTIDVSVQYHDSGNSTDALGQPLTGGDGGDGGGVTPVPALYYATPLGDRAHFGVAFTAPFGLKTDYNDNWIGRYQAIHSEVKAVDLMLSFSYALTDDFSLGVSAIGQRTSADLSSAVDVGAILAAQGFTPAYLPQNHDGRAKIKGDATDYGWQIGALWKLGVTDRVALNYRAKIDHTIKGTGDFTIPADAAAVFNGAGIGLFQDTDATAQFSTPAITSLSYWHQGSERFGFGIDLSRTEWSSFKELRVDYDNPAQPPTVEPENWDDTWYGALGFDYRLNQVWTLRAGIAYDQTPTHDSTRTPRVPDGSRRWIAVGAGYQPSDAFEFNVGYAHLFVDDADVNDTSPTGDHLVGSFQNSGDLLGVSGTFRF